MLSPSSQSINTAHKPSNLDVFLNATLDEFISVGCENIPIAEIFDKFNSLHKTVSEHNLINLHYWLWNVRSMNDNKFNYIKYLLSGRAHNEVHSPDIIALTETWMRTSGKFKTFNLTNYTHYSVSRNGRRGGGVSVHIKNTFNTQLVNSFVSNDIEMLQIKITFSSADELQIIVIYRPPNGSVEEFFNTLETIFSGCDGTKLIMGDINLSENGSNSNYFTPYCDIVESFGYKRINKAITYFYNNTNGSDRDIGSILDHIISDENQYNFVLTSPKTPYSDHNIIMGSLITDTKYENGTKLKKHLIKKLNRKSALNEIQCLFSMYDIQGFNINEKTNNLIEHVQSIVNRNYNFLSIKTRDINFVLPSWADKEYITLCNAVHNLHEKIWKLKSKKKPTSLLEAKHNHLMTAKHEMEERKTKMYFSNIILSNPKVSWNIINELCGRRKTADRIALRHNNVIVTDELQIANIFHEQFLTTIENKNRTILANHRGPFVSNTFQFQEVDESLILNFLHGLEANKSAGFDDIQPSIWKLAGDDVCAAITSLINEMIETDPYLKTIDRFLYFQRSRRYLKKSYSHNWKHSLINMISWTSHNLVFGKVKAVVMQYRTSYITLPMKLIKALVLFFFLLMLHLHSIVCHMIYYFKN